MLTALSTGIQLAIPPLEVDKRKSKHRPGLVAGTKKRTSILTMMMMVTGRTELTMVRRFFRPPASMVLDTDFFQT
jgi:hypothetical protein